MLLLENWIEMQEQIELSNIKEMGCQHFHLWYGII